jgi:hypothetical protein
MFAINLIKSSHFLPFWFQNSQLDVCAHYFPQLLSDLLQYFLLCQSKCFSKFPIHLLDFIYFYICDQSSISSVSTLRCQRLFVAWIKLLINNQSLKTFGFSFLWLQSKDQNASKLSIYRWSHIFEYHSI